MTPVAQRHQSRRTSDEYGKQLYFDFCQRDPVRVDSEIAEASKSLAFATGNESRGVVFTRSEVVDFILDLIGYTEDQDLSHLRILEPSFGGGDFLIPIMRRLLRSWKKHCSSRTIFEDLSGALRAVELHATTFEWTKARAMRTLIEEGLPDNVASRLLSTWLQQGDFLLEDISGDFDLIVGNPPYVRQEIIPPVLLKEYRRRYLTMYDRADLYIPFIERSLHLLAKGGRLGFICSDRWMKNRYGGPLRNLISEQFHLQC